MSAVSNYLSSATASLISIRISSITSELRDASRKVQHVINRYYDPLSFELRVPDFVDHNDFIGMDVFLENGGRLTDQVAYLTKNRTLIGYAIHAGTPEMVRFLLSKERDIDPELQRLCIKGLLKTDKFYEMIGPIVDAGIFSNTLMLTEKDREFFNLFIEKDRSEAAFHLLSTGNIPLDTVPLQQALLEKIVTHTDIGKYFGDLDIYNELIAQIRVKIEEDVKAHMKEFPILLEESHEREVAQARRERLQKERIFNPFDLARSFGEDGKLLVALVNNGNTEGIQALMDQVEVDKRSLVLESELSENENFYQLAEHFKTFCKDPTQFAELRKNYRAFTNQ